MIKKLLFAALFILPLFAVSQDHLDIEFYVEKAQLESLIHSVPSFAEAFAFVANQSDETVIVSITTENITIPAGWFMNEGFLRQYDGSNYVLEPGDQVDWQLFAEIILNDVTTIEAKAIQDIRIIGTLENGTEVHNELLTFCYEFEVTDIPSPTFNIYDTFQDSIPADTIYIPFEIIDPFTREFHAWTELIYIDNWHIERFLTAEPQELISENITEIDCDLIDYNYPDKRLCKGDTMDIHNHQINVLNFSGKLGFSNDYRYELLVKFYDRVDSVNSNQLIRFIAQDADCVRGKEAELVLGQNNIHLLCEGSDLTLNALPQYSSLTWRNNNTGETFNGATLVLTDIQESTTYYITTLDDNGCLLYTNIYLELEERHEPIVIQPQGFLEFCLGENAVLTTISGYSDIIWLDLANGNTYFGESIELINIQNNVEMIVKAKATDGCTVTDLIYINVDPRGKRADIFPNGSVYYVCRGGARRLESDDAFENVTWTLASTGETTTNPNIVLFDITQEETIYVTASNDGPCDFYQELLLIPEDLYSDNLVANEQFISCGGQSVFIEGNPEYTDFIWRVENTGEIFTGNSIEIVGTNDYLSIVVSATETNGNGCIYTQNIAVFPDVEGYYDENLLESDAFNYNCSIVLLEAADGYTDYTWYLYENNQGFVVAGIGQEIELDFSGEPSSYVPLMKLEAKNANGCFAFYEFEFLINGNPQGYDLIDVAALGSYCEGESITLTTIEMWASYQWSYQGQTYTDPQLEIDVSNDPVYLLVLDENGCAYETDFSTGLLELDPPSLCLVSSDDDNGNNIILWEDPTISNNITEYLIYREGSATGVFDLIGTVAASEENRFVDTESNPTQQAYRYHVRSANECGTISEPSNEHKTIHLTINIGTNNNINLIWDSYEGIVYDQVKILRGSSPTTLEEYVVLPSTVLSFTDQNPPAGDVFYQMEITSEIECNTGKATFLIRSNIAELLVTDAVDDYTLFQKIYPNPFRDQLTVDIPAAVRFELFNAACIKVLTENLDAGQHKINTEALLQGVYLIKATSGNKQQIEQFVRI